MIVTSTGLSPYPTALKFSVNIVPGPVTPGFAIAFPAMLQSIVLVFPVPYTKNHVGAPHPSGDRLR